MPKVPKWMADGMEKLFSGSYHPVSITQVKDITESLRFVRFEGDFSRIKKEFVPGNIIEFRVNDTEFRHYTPASFDAENGICEVLFYLHNMGPGSTWASTLQEGQEVNLLGPGGKTKFATEANYHIIFGDETSLGLMQCLSQEAIRLQQSFLCIAELEQQHVSWMHSLNLEAKVLKKSMDSKAAPSISYLENWLNERQDDIASMSFYLTGNADSVKNMRAMLRRRGIHRNQIQAEPYWKEGKTGL